MSAVVAATLAAAAVALALGARLPRVPPRPVLLLLPGGALAGLVPLVVSGRRLVLALVVLAAVLAVTQHVRRARRRSAAERRAEQVLLACEGLAADLTAGQPPSRALERAARDWPELAPVAAASDLGADVPEALRRLAALPGADRLQGVAAAWQVAHRSGAGLAGSVGRVARALQDERSTRRLVQSELAAARATARMMALLPLLFLVLGSGLGGDPVGFLLDTPVGLGCLAGGLGLAHLGVLWLDRIAAGVPA